MSQQPTMSVSGPMFESAVSGPWRSIHRQSGAHYNTYACRDDNGMSALREFFAEAGSVNEMNFVLFSTSGVHGTYSTIEAAEAMLARGNKYEDGEDGQANVTFLLIQPRICCLRYGNALPLNADDIAFLKQIRASSWTAASTIGADK